MRRSYVLILAVLCSSIVMLAAVVVAYAEGPTDVYGWVPQIELSQSGSDASRGPRVAVHQGRIHVMWAEDTYGTLDPYYISSADLGTSWSPIERVTTGQPSYDIALGIESGGLALGCWCDQKTTEEQDFRVMCAGTPAWVAEEPVTKTKLHILGSTLAASDGKIHLVWSRKDDKPTETAHDLWYAWTDRATDSWSDPIMVVDTGPASRYGKMVADHDGNLHLVWQENVSPTNEIMYISGTVQLLGATIWHEPVTLTEDVSTNATSPDIALAEDGTVHTVFGADVQDLTDTQDVYHLSFPVSNTETISLTKIEDSRVHISKLLPQNASPSLFVQEGSIVHVVWNGEKEEDGDLSDRIYYARSDDGGANWSAAVAVSRDDAWPDGFPDVVATGEMVHVVFQQQTSFEDNDVYYSRKLPFVSQFILVMKDYQ